MGAERQRLHPAWLLVAIPACVIAAPFYPIVMLWNWIMPRQFANGGLERPL